MRSFPDLHRDSDALREGESTWQDFKRERGGDKAVAGARFNMALKAAQAPAEASASSMAESRRALGLPATPNAGGGAANTPKDRLVQYSERTRFVAGKNFFLNGDQWADSDIQKHATAKRVRIEFGSSEYFILLAKHPEASPWVALGEKVQFLLDCTIYEIYE
jgi:hypothetical protein